MLRRILLAGPVLALFLLGALIVAGSSSGHRSSSVGPAGVASDPDAAIAVARYRAAAYPRSFVSPHEIRAAWAAAGRVPVQLTAADFPGAGNRNAAAAAVNSGLGHHWTALGPAGGHLSAYTQHLQNGLPVTSGRVTALLVSPTCVPGNCRLWLGAAGGGLWRTDDALARTPAWMPIDNGLGSNSIGSLALDPNDPSHRTVYAGTGEGNLSFDSEAGVGLYKSLNGGDSWSLVPGSYAVAGNRSIGAIAVEPSDPSVIWIGTALGLRGSKDQAVLFYGPGPTMGLYRSTDGGATFTLQTTFGATPGASAADVTGLAFDPTTSDTLYASTQNEGVWRRAASLDGNANWHRIFASTDRTQVAVSSHTRVWLTAGIGADSKNQGEIFRIDNAEQPFAAVTATQVSSPSNGASGFCESQCSYDQALAVDPAHPDTLWVGGSNDYNEASYGGSNGRALLRTLDGGQMWTDMTTSSSDEAHGLHPDLHAIALDPSDANTAFVGSDGGIYRTGGQFASGVAHPAAGKPCTSSRCKQLLSSIPTEWIDMNAGLNTLQFQKVSVPNNASGDIQGGTQDNGTWEFSGRTGKWQETLGGDGGLTAIDATDPAFRLTTQLGPDPLASRHAGAPHSWIDVAGQLKNEAANSFQLLPIIADPLKHATLFAGTNQVWRSPDFGRSGWVPLGFTRSGTISVLARAPSDPGTLWAGTGLGNVVISPDVDAPDLADVHFTDPSRAPLPARFVSGIAVDPANPDHAWISYSGYNIATPGDPGHVFSMYYNPVTGTARFRDISRGIGDQPVDDLAYDPATHDLYAATDFGVLRLPNGSDSWERAALGLPIVTVDGVSIAARRRALYAATSGRGVYSLQLPAISNRFTVTHIHRRGRGSLSFNLTVPDPGTLDVLETAPLRDFARPARAGPQTPGPGRFTFGRAHIILSRNGMTLIMIKPTARGRNLVSHHRRTVWITLWVTYTPADGKARTKRFANLRLTQ